MAVGPESPWFLCPPCRVPLSLWTLISYRLLIPTVLLDLDSIMPRAMKERSAKRRLNSSPVVRGTYAH